MRSLKFLLISQSPRRRQILEEAGYQFLVDTVKVSESFEKNVNPGVVAQEIARRKARAYIEQTKSSELRDFLVISADTIVVLGDQILGKPENSKAAAACLRKLSGKTHCVITGVYMFCAAQNREVCFADETEVQFRDLTDQEIWDYVNTGDPLDKAGSYGIQGMAKTFVNKTTGSFLNVVGLPMEKVEATLAEEGWIVSRK